MPACTEMSSTSAHFRLPKPSFLGPFLLQFVFLTKKVPALEFYNQLPRLQTAELDPNPQEREFGSSPLGPRLETEFGVRATTLTHILFPTTSASRSLARGRSIVPKPPTGGYQAADGSPSPSGTSDPLNLHRGHSRSSYPLVFTAGCRLRTRFRPHPEASCLRGAGHEPGFLIASER